LIPGYNLELWTKWKDLIDSNVYDMIQLDGLCIVSSMPIKVNIDDRKRIHSDKEAAVIFKDGYEVYGWHGTIISKEWINDKNSITKEVFIKEENAEKRRCIQEILGKDFINLLETVIIDSDIDLQGNKMELLKTKEIDKIAGKYIYYYHCICPSTKREYYLCVPECKNVWDAKNWTLKNKQPVIRHGDVILRQIDVKHEFPIYES
jgi:hypothetical protein